MSWWRNLHLFGKICLILAGTLSLLFLLNMRINRAQQTDAVLAEAVEKARLVSFTAIRTREYLSNEISQGGIVLSSDRYGMIPAVASTRVGGIIGADIGYDIRQIATRYRNPANKPDPFEAEILSRMEQDRTLREYWQIDRSSEVPVFRYMQPFNASESCLECHGDPERAPAFIRELFPQEKDNSYHYQLGEVIGAVSVTIPLAGIDAQIARMHRTDILISGGMFGALLLLLGLMIRHTVTTPLATVSQAIRQAIKTGRFGTPLPRRGRDEIGQLIDSFNEMAIEVQTKNDHLTESERRYRILTDTAHDAIISFLPAGQIILFNRSAGALFGYGKGEIIGKNLQELIHEEWREMHEQGFETCLRMEEMSLLQKSRRIPVVRRDGKKIEVTMTLSRAEQEGSVFYTAMLRTDPE